MLVYPTNQLAFASEEARQAHERRYKNFQSAQNVWRQLSVEDRVYVLQKAGYDAVPSIREPPAGSSNCFALACCRTELPSLLPTVTPLFCCALWLR